MLILVIWWWLLLELLRRGICLPDVPGCDSEIFEHFLEGLNISPPSIYISKARPCSLRWWSSVQTDRLVCTADVVLYQHSLTLCILRAVSQEKLKAPTHNFTELSPGPALISHLLDEIRWGSVPGPLPEIPTSHLWTAKDSNLGRSLGSLREGWQNHPVQAPQCWRRTSQRPMMTWRFSQARQYSHRFLKRLWVL